MLEIDSYTAGLFDGEGTVTFASKGKGKNKVPIVCMTNTSFELIDFLHNEYGGHYNRHHSEAQLKKHPKWNEAWAWRLETKETLIFLKRILPFMKEKKKISRSKYILDNYKNILPKQRGRALTQEEKTARENFEKEFFFAINGPDLVSNW